MIFGALIEAIDLAQLSRLDPEAAREEIRDIVSEIIALKNVVMSIAEQEELLDDICNDVLGYGRSNRCSPATTSPTSWSTARDGPSSRSAARSSSRGPVPGQPAAHEHLPADREPGRPPGGRILADLRCPPAGRIARQRDRAAARHRRTLAHHPQVQEGQADPRAARRFGRSRRKGPRSSRSSDGCAATSSSPAARARARRRC